MRWTRFTGRDAIGTAGGLEIRLTHSDLPRGRPPWAMEIAAAQTLRLAHRDKPKLWFRGDCFGEIFLVVRAATADGEFPYTIPPIRATDLRAIGASVGTPGGSLAWAEWF